MSAITGATSQVGAQGTGSGSQASQSDGQGNQQSLGDQLYGQQGQQGQNQPGAGEGQLLEGQRAGESLADYGRRMNAELVRARNDAGRYRTQLRQYEGDTSGNQGSGQQGQDQGAQQGQANPVAQLTTAVQTLQRELADERAARKAEQVTTTITNALAAAGAVNPGRAVRLIDTTGLQAGSSGIPTTEAIAEAVDALKAEMPQIFGDVRGSGDGGAGNAGTGTPDDFNAQIRKRAGLR